MDEQRPRRRRELTSEEKKNLSRQQIKEEEQQRKQARRDAKLREQARREARHRGEDAHVVIEIPAEPPKKKRPPKPRKKTLPEMIEKETDRKVRDMEPTDHRDGYYVNEVGVRRRTAEKQRIKRQKAIPKPLSPKQRRLRRIIAYISIIVAVIIVGVVLSLTVLFKTESIKVKGNKYYEDSMIINLSGVREGDNIFMASIFADTGKIKATLPYIKEAKVNFTIPNGLIINVENQAPYYSLKSGDDYFMISKDDRILEKVNKKPDDLMFIEAPKLKSNNIGDYVEFEKEIYTKTLDEITDSLKKNKIKDITSISVKESNNIKITYDNRILIKLGLPDSIDYKIRTAFVIINTKLDPNKTGTIMGILNVSGCNTGSKKSYFQEVSIKEKEPDKDKKTENKKKSESKKTKETTKPTTKPTTEATGETEAQSVEEYPTDAYTEEYTEPYTDPYAEQPYSEEVTYYDDIYGYYNESQSQEYYGANGGYTDNYYGE